MHPKFLAANDQYLEQLRQATIAATLGWLTESVQPAPLHITIMRASYALASLGDEAVRGTLEDDLAEAFEQLYRGQYELTDFRDDFGHFGISDDEMLQMAIGFVIGAARAWVVVKRWGEESCGLAT